MTGSQRSGIFKVEWRIVPRKCQWLDAGTYPVTQGGLILALTI